MPIGLTGARYRNLPGRWVRAGFLRAASLVNQEITYKAKVSGTAGNGITVTILAGGVNNRALAVTVSGKAITIAPATDGSGVITSTRTAVRTAVNASGPASALVVATGTSATLIGARATTPLAGGSSYVRGTSR